jgi:cobalt-zinc-cadmium efflux system protein
LLVVELVAGLLAHSLALVADAGHLLTDVAALGAALWAIPLAARPASGRFSFGLKRAEVMAAAVNGVLLVAVSGLVVVEAAHRIAHPAHVIGAPVVAVAAVGVVVSLVATSILAGGERRSLNVEGAFQHVLMDAAGFLATAVAGVLILTTGFRRADSIASLVVVVLMLRAAWRLLAESGRVLLEGVPEGVDLAIVRDRLLQADAHVVDVHDLHAWVVTSDLPAMSAHVVVDDSCFEDGHAPKILDTLQSAISGGFDVAHSTFQLEPAGHAAHEAPGH